MGEIYNPNDPNGLKRRREELERPDREFAEKINEWEKHTGAIRSRQEDEDREKTIKKRREEYEAALAANTDGKKNYEVGELKKQLDELEGKNPYPYATTTATTSGEGTTTTIGGQINENLGPTVPL